MKFTGNKIRSLDNQTTQEDTLIPRHPFTMQINASKAGGKTTTILNMLINPNMYKKKFHRIIWISPTATLDEKIQELNNHDIIGKNQPLIDIIIDEKLKNKNITKGQIMHLYNQFNERVDPEFHDTPGTVLQDVISDQKKIIRKYGKKNADHVLLILDDLAGEKRFYNSELMVNMIIKSRHYFITCIMTSQSYYCIPKKIRDNNTCLLLFDTANITQLKLIYDENTNRLNYKEFYELFRQVMTQDHAFMQFTCQNKQGRNLIRCFEEFIDY